MCHSSGSEKVAKDCNPFALLDNESDGGGSEKGKWNTIGGVSSSGSNTESSSQPSPSQPFCRSASTGSKPKKGGWSLANLAAGLSGSNSTPSHHVPHHGRHHKPTHKRDPRSQPRSSSTGITCIQSESAVDSLLGSVPSSPGKKVEGVGMQPQPQR